VKFAGHAVRLGYQGIDYMRTGRIPVPMPEDQRERIVAIRTGLVPLAEVIQEIEHLQGTLTNEMKFDRVPEEPDTATVERFLVEQYLEAWGVPLAKAVSDIRKVVSGA